MKLGPHYAKHRCSLSKLSSKNDDPLEFNSYPIILDLNNSQLTEIPEHSKGN